MSSFWVVKYEGDQLLGVRVSGRKGRWSFSRVEPLSWSTLAHRSVILLSTSPQAYFFRETLTRGPAEVLSLQAEEKVRGAGFFTGPFEFSLHRISEGPGQVEVGILALERQEVERWLGQLGQGLVRPKALYHQCLALAYLVAGLRTEPVLVAHFSDQGLWLVVVEGQHPVYMRFQAVDEFLGVEGFPVEENVLAVLDYYQRFFRRTLRHIFPCGPHRERLHHLGALEEWSPEFPAWNLSGEDLLTHPEFFGAVRVPASYSLLPETHRSFLRAFEWARYAGGVLFVLTLINYGLVAYWHRQNRILDQELLRTSRILEFGLRELQRDYPPEEVKKLQNYLKWKQKFEKQPRMDEFLWWLASTVPDQTRVSRLEMQRDKNGNYRMRMVFISRGPLARVHADFLRFLDAVRRRASVEDSRFHYDDFRKEARFEIVLRGIR